MFGITRCSVAASSLGMLNDPVQADGVAVVVFQFSENNSGEDGQTTQNEERQVDAVNHFRRGGVKAVGNEERGGQRGCRHAETDRHLLHRARDGASTACLLLGDVGVRKRIHTRILQRGKEPKDKRLRDDKPYWCSHADRREQDNEYTEDQGVGNQYSAITKTP